MAMDRPTFTNVCEATSLSHELDNMRPIHRKGKKLLAEKKRRARINNCLIQIRDLVCEGSEEKDSDIDKMEKAEILEKTLEVLTRFRREYNTTNLSSSSSCSGLHSSSSARQVMAVRYASGFSSCAEESIRYIQGSRLVPAEVKAQLQNHLRTIARRMETKVADVETLPAVSPGAAQFAPQYPMHPYSGHPTATLARNVSSTLATAGHVVSSSGPVEAEPLSGFRIPSPIHTSTPVAPHPSQTDQEDIVRVIATTPNNTVSSYANRGRYECITPEIDVVAEGDDRLSCAASESQSAKQHQAQPPPTPELATLQSLDNIKSPKFPITSSPIQSHQMQSITPVSSRPYSQKEPFTQPSPQQYCHNQFSHPYQTNTPSPLLFANSLNCSTVSPSTSHTLYTYHGYEPLPSTPSGSVAMPHFYSHTPAAATANRSRSNTCLSTSLSASKPQVTSSSTPALDLCVKRQASHQISPETMWRPW